MTKGSTAYVPWIAAAIAVCLERPAGWRWRHFLGGLGLAFALTLPWHLTMLALHGGAFARAFYIGEGAMPAVQAIENHPGDWRYYPMMLHALFEPWLLLAAAATAWTIWRYCRRAAMPAAIWLIAWAGVVLSMCTVFATKMAWYAAPALPALAALAALATVELSRRRGGWVVLAAVAAFAAYQLQIKHWPPLSVRLALATTAVAALALILAPAARSRWQVWLAAACAVFPLALHLRVMHAAVADGKPMVDWMDLRDDEEPWRELSARLARELPNRPIVLVEFPPDPASWFYLARLHDPRLIEPCPLPRLSERLAAGDRPTIIVREERMPNLDGLGLHERFRDRALVVLTAD